MTEQRFLQIRDSIISNEEINKFNNKGLCRLWVRATVNLLRDKKHLIENCKLEIHEVQIETGLAHTFIKLFIEQETYILDGTGAGIYESYFGPEVYAPYLKNSHLDILHYLLLSKI